MSRVSICNIPVDALTMEETIGIIDKAIVENKPIHHVVINAAKVVNAQKDADLRESIVNCDIINADGQAIVWAARLLNCPLPQRVAGIDLMESGKACLRQRLQDFFLGAKEEVVQGVVENTRSNLVQNHRWIPEWVF
jgi:N-acetylglucosaminyldiphosphoundecaprenol N-acetyl-beta-D-mannosaminyltransferase